MLAGILMLYRYGALSLSLSPFSSCSQSLPVRADPQPVTPARCLLHLLWPYLHTQSGASYGPLSEHTVGLV